MARRFDDERCHGPLGRTRVDADEALESHMPVANGTWVIGLLLVPLALVALPLVLQPDC